MEFQHAHLPELHRIGSIIHSLYDKKGKSRITQVVSVVQLISAASKVVAMDRKKRALREAKSN